MQLMQNIALFTSCSMNKEESSVLCMQWHRAHETECPNRHQGTEARCCFKCGKQGHLATWETTSCHSPKLTTVSNCYTQYPLVTSP